MSYSACIFSIMAANDLTAHGALASMANVLNKLSQNDTVFVLRPLNI